MPYVIGIDQSTQGTKVLLFDGSGKILCRVDRKHRQIISHRGWVSHDMQEVYENLLDGVRELLNNTRITAAEIAAVGLSNQRETTVCWGANGTPLAPAIVWQCSRADELIRRKFPDSAVSEQIRLITGLPLSPFFPAAKMAWILENVPQAAKDPQLHLGTVDSYLVYRLTEGRTFATDVTNASRTQLMDLDTCRWSETLCSLFGIPQAALPQILHSDALFGTTTFDGLLEAPIPIRGVMGDSHCALFGHGCLEPGKMKTTYGTGSSMMLNIGTQPVRSQHGLATSVAWGWKGAVSYVLEGNINYTGAVMTWLKEDLELISSISEIEPLISKASPADKTVLVPAFTGLGAPYWNDAARASIVGMGRTTRKPELVKAAVESIGHQICDVFDAMALDYGKPITQLRADGGPTRNEYLMQFQSDLIRQEVVVPSAEELSAMGAAFMAGIVAGVYDENAVFSQISYRHFTPEMTEESAADLRCLWKEAVRSVLAQTEPTKKQ